MKTSELTGAALDWVVAKCEGVSVTNVKQASGYIETAWDKVTKWENASEIYAPSTDWAQGGPIIEREKLSIGTRYTSDQIYHDADVLCWARTAIGGFLKYGQTPLIAAMRCYVASKLGDEVNVPDGLLP